MQGSTIKAKNEENAKKISVKNNNESKPKPNSTKNKENISGKNTTSAKDKEKSNSEKSQPESRIQDNPPTKAEERQQGKPIVDQKR